jgi:sarcosine oxidase, subunit alpha
MPLTPPTAAARALAAGRPGLATSFRLHRPRGAFCHAGWCQQCRITLADGRIALACRTSEFAARRRSPGKRLLGRLAEGLPPWFYERHLLRPRILRQFYLDRLRRLSAAPVLPSQPAAIGGHWRRRRSEVIIVGGGLAGLAAAKARRGAGRDVLLVEAEESLGGRAKFQAHQSKALAEALERSVAVAAWTGTVCVGLYEQGREALLIGPEGPTLLAFEELVVATGAYDRLPGFVGNDLPGIIGLRAFERLAALRAVPNSWSVGVFAECEGAAAAIATGHRLAWIAGPGDLPANEGPGFPASTLLAAEGRGRITGVRLDPGECRACDLLVLGFSQPSYELQLQAGQHAALAGSPATVVTQGEAAIPISVVGDSASQPYWASRPATLAAPEAFVCLCEDVRRRHVMAAIADGFSDVELLKRRTGVGTGPCQGKLCHGEMLACLAEADRTVGLPTVRPLVRPILLAQLAAADHG